MKKHHRRIIVTVALLMTVLAILAISIYAQNRSEQTTPELEIYANNISLEETLHLKYAVCFNDISDNDKVQLLIWTAPNDEYIYGTQDAIVNYDEIAMVGGKECLIFDYANIAAKEITDVVYARAYVIHDGQLYYSNVKKYSVLQYVYNKLGLTSSETPNKALKDLLHSLLEYGASAQTYFNYKTDTLATDKFIKVTLENAVFDDGSNFTFIKEGCSLTVSPIADSRLGTFVYWTDAEGNYITDSHELTISAGNNNLNYRAVYEMHGGGRIDGAGAVLQENGFANTPPKFDPDKAINVSASQLQTILKSPKPNQVYILSEGDVLKITSSINGQNTVIIAPSGVNIENTNSITISDLIIVGELSVKNSDNVNLKRVCIESSTNGVVTDSYTDNLTINNCRIIAKNTAIKFSSDNSLIHSSFISADFGVNSMAQGTTIYNSHIIGNKDAVILSGEDSAVKNCTLSAGADYNGIIVADNSLNTLLAYNKITNAIDSIFISQATNTVVLFNSVYNVNSNRSTNTYIVKNSLGGSLRLNGNNYLLCDENSYMNNNVDHTPVLINNTNVNGNSIMDVTERNKVGANEELLPHTNKDLFLDMERKKTVKDAVSGASLPLDTYIEQNSKTHRIVIVPPGVYSTPAGDFMSLTSDMSDTEIYAFGVYNEHGFNNNKQYLATKGTNYILRLTECNNVSIYGLTIGYNYQSSGQVHVLSKLGNNKVLVIPSAGYDLSAGFGSSNPEIFSTGHNTHYLSGTYNAYGGINYSFSSSDVRNADGTLTLTLDANSYMNVNVGDVFTTRMSGDNQHTVGITNCNSTKLKDFTIYGYTAALAIVVSGTSENTSLERVHNTAKAPFLIDKTTYDKYASLEKTYGVDLEISLDAYGRYRGSIPRMGSVDATHVTGAAEGLKIESCLFESMCDDGSNQRGSSSRLHKIKDNGDGTATIFIKGMVTSTYHSLNKQAGKTLISYSPNSFAKDDRIYIYTSRGALVCDTKCLTSANDEDELSTTYDFDGIKYLIYVKSVKVPIEDVNFDSLEGYDLSDNSYDMTHKVIVDNLNYCSSGFVIDNLLVQNSTARGILVKTIDSSVMHSTFRNVAMTGNLLSVETSWGESTVAKDIVIKNNLYDNTGNSGRLYSDPIRANIAISALSTYGNANIDSLQANNILITGCEFRNYGHPYGIYVNGAKNVRIIDNVFDPLYDDQPQNFIKILTALNIEISGNKYKKPNGTLETIKGIQAEDYTRIHGTDVGNLFKEDCDIFIGQTHISAMRVFVDDRSNLDIAKMMANQLSDVCGYSISYSSFFKENTIRLVAKDSESDQIDSTSYTITSDGHDLVITASTRASLIYAVQDFVNYIKELNKIDSTITFNNGYNETRSFTIQSKNAYSTSLFKYSGIWRANGTSMSSSGDIDYVEFNVTGSSFTILFSKKSEFKLYIDDQVAGTFCIDSEMTCLIPHGSHTIKIESLDKEKNISFAGVKHFNSIISRTEDKAHYIQFIGDSMVDSDESFAHHIGRYLCWDYSVLVADSLPQSTNTGRTPDIVFIFLGTDAINSDTSSNDINTFKTKYQDLVKRVLSTYTDCKRIYLMQAISTSDPNDMFNTSHARYQAIASIKSEYFASDSKIKLIDASTVSDFGIEFDAQNDPTHPNEKGSFTLLSGLVKYISKDTGYTDYYNHIFSLSKMNNYNGSKQLGLSENGIIFNRYIFKDSENKPVNGHVFISGDDYANKIVIDSGRYLVFKYRASGDYSISFNLRTNDYGKDVAESGKGYVSTVSRASDKISTEWRVAVLDLAQFKHYTTDVDCIGVQVRITTTSSQLDIAHVSIVDTISDANLVVMSLLGDSEYTLYEKWSDNGIITPLTGKDVSIPEEKPTIDISYVNHNFGLLSMRMYDGYSIKAPNVIMMSEGDISFNRFEFQKTGHIFFKGSNNFASISGKTGNYIVIKYRATNNSYLSLEMQTSHLPYDTTYPYNTMIKSVKQSNKIPSGWEVSVIDLAKFTSYKRDSDLDVLIRITTACSTVDISYIGLVDDVAEAERYIKDMGDKSYVYYTNWSDQGVSHIIN